MFGWFSSPWVFWPSPGNPGSWGRSHSLFVLQCLALQAQITALTKQNEQHIKELEKNKSQMSGVEAAASDPSEKVSWYFKWEASHLYQAFRKNMASMLC